MPIYKRHRSRIPSCILFLSAQLSMFAVPPGFAENAPVKFEIAAGNAADSLSEFSVQSGLQMLFMKRTVQGYQTQAVTGELEARDALKQLLEGTGLTFEFVNERTVAVKSNAAAAISPHVSPLQLAQAAAVPASAGEETGAGSSNRAIEEVIVTAQKRSERLQDVPVPVTALMAESLTDSNQMRLQDYYTKVPGLSLTQGLRGDTAISIRGLTTGYGTTPTVAIVVDDLPYGSSTGSGFGFITPEFDPSDLARIEVLRGPQGTLYGASSLGGLIKYVTIDPSMDAVSGRVQAGVNSIYNADELGYSVRASINVPLGESWAVRASGFMRQEGGYIDNPIRGEDGINGQDVDGGRLSVLWKPSKELSLKLGAMLQNSRTHGSPEVHRLSGLGDLEQNILPGVGFANVRRHVFDATLKARIGNADLISISGYSVNKLHDSYNASPFFSNATEANFGVRGLAWFELAETTKVMQEIRLTIPAGERFEWLVGAFYTDEDAEVSPQDAVAMDPSTGERRGVFHHGIFPSKYIEYAAFADLTWKLTERFDIQFGGRQSKNRQSSSTYVEGPWVPVFAGRASPDIIPEIESRDDPFTYLVTPRLKVSPDLMIYGRLASGYRAGGPNPAGAVLGYPATFGPDKTQNYEIGVKGNLPNHVLSFDASVYYIDWKDVQVLLAPPGTSFYANASSAKSEGVELSMELRPLTGLTIAAWGAWNDAVLTEPFPPAAGQGSPGNRLPGSSRFSGNFSVDQEFSLLRNMTGFVGASLSYLGDRASTIANLPLVFPSYTKTDLRLGVRSGSWMANLYANNIGDERGVLGIRAATGGILYIQPRTVGLSLTRNF